MLYFAYDLIKEERFLIDIKTVSDNLFGLYNKRNLCKNGYKFLYLSFKYFLLNRYEIV